MNYDLERSFSELILKLGAGVNEKITTNLSQFVGSQGQDKNWDRPKTSKKYQLLFTF
jgi:hypothetical protein